MTPDAFMLDQPPCLPLVCSYGSPSEGIMHTYERGTMTERQEAEGDDQCQRTGQA